jgi:RNA polymerase sigma factor for flagellar operon FliA
MASLSLWQVFREQNDPEARDQLVSEHLRLVYHVAWQVMKSSPVDVEFDELLGAGTIGLMHAIETFDPDRGLAFSTLAAPRIRGAILDDLRKRDVVPRSVRKKQRQMNKAKDSLMGTLNRSPEPQETADELGIELEEFWRWNSESEHAMPVSLDQPKHLRDGSSLSGEELLPGDDPEELEENINRGEELQILKDEILKLKKQERLVLSLYYFEELKLHEIASILGVTESRVSQIRSKAIQNLKCRLGHLREGAVA